MTDLAFSTTSPRPAAAVPLGEGRRLLLLYAVAFAALAAGATSVWSARHAAATMEPPLVLLLRFMAGMKALMALAAIGLTHWRLRTATSGGVLAGYLGALGLMTAAPGFIFSLAHIALGAALFHAGLLLFLLLAWKDEGVSLPTGSRSTAMRR